MANNLTVAKPQGMAMAGNGARGFDNFDNSDLIIPRLRLLQGLSQAVVDGLGIIGQFQDTLTGEILGDEVEVVLMGMKNGAVYFEAGKGMQCKSVDGITSIRGDSCKDCPFGHYHAGEWVDDVPPKCSSSKEFMAVTRKTLSGEESRPMVISFLKTSYKEGKRLASMARFTGKDIFANAYKITSEKIKNDKGTFAVLKLSPTGLITPEEFVSAESWYNILNNTNVKVHDDEMADEGIDDFNI